MFCSFLLHVFIDVERKETQLYK